jgi:hypothetical protein
MSRPFGGRYASPAPSPPLSVGEVDGSRYPLHMPRTLTLDDQRDRAHAWLAFIEANGRQPGNKPDAPSSESALYYWLNKHRKAESEGTLKAEVRAVLDQIAPAWREPSDPTRPNPELHAQRAYEYLTFTIKFGRTPSQVATGRAERTLQHWLSNQRATLAAGRMHPEVREAISAVLPGWDAPTGKPPRARSTVQPFAARLEALREYLALNDGLLPPLNGDDDATALGRWLRQQRLRLERGELKRARRRALDDLLPTWHVESRSDQKWDRRVAEVAAFRAEHGHLPRSARADDTERSLYTWLANNRSSDLSERQATILDREVPGWRGGAVRESWGARVREIQTFIEETGRRPRPQGSSPAESRMGFWLTRQRKARRNGELSSEAEALLSEAVPGWEVSDRGVRTVPTRARLDETRGLRRESRRAVPLPLERALPAISNDAMIERALRDVTNRYPVLPWHDPFEYAHRVIRRYLKLAARADAARANRDSEPRSGE